MQALHGIHACAAVLHEYMAALLLRCIRGTHVSLVSHLMTPSDAMLLAQSL